MNLKFKNRLLICFISVAALTLIASGFIFVGTLKKWLIMQYTEQSGIQMDEIESSLNRAVSSIEETIDSMMRDETIAKVLDDPSGWEIKKANTRLYDKTEKTRKLAVYYLFDNAGSCVLSTATSDTTPDKPIYWGVFKQAGTHSEEFIVSNANGDIYNQDSKIIVIKSLTKNEDCIGYAMAIMTEETLTDIFEGMVSSDCEMAILDGFWEEVYSTDKTQFSGLHDRRFLNDSFPESIEDSLYYFRKIELGDFTISICRNSLVTEGLQRSIYYAGFFVGLISLIICLVVSGVMTRNLLKPLNSITLAMNRVKQGDFSASIESKRRDEFGQLSRDFDDMTKALKVYIDLRTEAQKELSESNIAMMQAQLNPHFLYNTLDTIKWVAKANHVPELATLSSSLAKILRASISSDIFVKLSDEMELIENYIEIQKIRFPDNFSFDAELPIELEDAIVPKLILQPIVENAIVHGLKDRTHGHVFVNIYSERDRLIIDVEDDGRGMREEILNMLNERDREKLRGHIGFYNVDTIIRLHYGLNYGLHAQNLKTGGVKVTIELPVRFGEVASENRKHVQENGKELLQHDEDSSN